MRTRLLDFLVCPNCKRPFELDTSEIGEEIETGTLSCEPCNRAYPITDGIPRILDGSLSARERGTRDRFAYAWARFGENMSDNHSTEMLVRLPGWKEGDFKDKVVLDVGCGAGRYARMSSEYEARDVVAIDLGTAIDTAKALSSDHPNVHFVQANLHTLPFNEIFDIVYCMGVLHHTPDPIRSLNSIIKHGKPGGRIGIWVYSKEGNEIMGPLLNFFRTLTVRFPNLVNHGLAYAIIRIEEFFYALVLRHMKRHRYAEYMDYFNNFLSRNDRHYVAFDFLSTPLVHYLSKDQLQAEAERNRLENITVLHFLGNGHCLTATKP